MEVSGDDRVDNMTYLRTRVDELYVWLLHSMMGLLAGVLRGDLMLESCDAIDLGSFELLFDRFWFLSDADARNY